MSHTLLDALFEQRLLVVAGKGGSGKSTIARALACAGALLGKRVMLACCSDTPGQYNHAGILSRGGGSQEAGKALYERAWINPRDVLARYVHGHVKIRKVSSRITESRLFGLLVDASPGLKEMMILSSLVRWAGGMNPPDEKGIFDTVVFDAPGTGHLISMLEAPARLSLMLSAGPLASMAESVLSFIRNQQKTSLCIVMTPDDLSVSEGLDLFSHACGSMNIKVACALFNRVYPVLFTEEETETLDAIHIPSAVHAPASSLESSFSGPRSDGPFDITMEAAARYARKQKQQQVVISRFVKETGTEPIQVPELFGRDPGDDGFMGIARLILGDLACNMSGEALCLGA